MSKNLKLIISILLLGMGLVVYFLWPTQQESAPTEPPPIGVRATTVSKMALPDQANSFGSLHARHDLKLRSELAGVVKVIGKPSGARVAKGDVLLELDHQSQLASLQKARSAAELQGLEYGRAKTLVDQKVIAKRDLDSKKNLLDAALAEVAVAKDQLDKTTIKAPFAGKLGIWQVNEGDFVPAGATLVELVDNKVLRVRYNLPERYLSRLQLGQQVTIKSAAYPNERFAGQVTVISPMVDPKTRNIELEAEINNEQSKLYPGLSAEVIQQLAAQSGGLAVPEESVTYSIEGAAIYRAKPQQNSTHYTIERVVVQAGIAVNGMVPIAKGIAAGDLVVTEGVQKIRDGQTVQLLPDHQSEDK